MKKLIFVMAAILSLSAHSFSIAGKAANPTKIHEIKNIVKKYRSKNLENIIREFVKVSAPSRFVGTSGHRGAFQYILERIKKGQRSNKELLIVNDFTPSINTAVKMFQDDFKNEVAAKLSATHPSYKLWANYTSSIVSILGTVRNIGGKNIVWEKKGTKFPNEVLVIGAHYDTISIDKKSYVVSKNRDMPGADNNGTGVSALLALIEVLQFLELERTVQVVFFDFEDIGYLGSLSFANKYLKEEKGKKFAGFINAIMLGFDGRASDKIKKYGNMKLYGRSKNSKDKELAKMFESLGKKVSSGVKFKYLDNSFKGSSVVSFWNYDIPTLVMTHDRENNPNDVRQYTPNDFVETLNLKTFYNSFKYLAGTVIGWSNGIK